MYDMMSSSSASRMSAAPVMMQGAVRSLRGRSGMPAMDPISLAGAPRRAGVRRGAGNARICSVRTTGERRCALR